MFDNWVTKYALSYSLNGRHWFMVKDKKKSNSRPKVSKCFSRSPNSEQSFFSSQAKVGQTLRILYETEMGSVPRMALLFHYDRSS